MTAIDFLNHDRAGLALAGRNADGDYEWIGTDKMWRLYQLLSDDL